MQIEDLNGLVEEFTALTGYVSGFRRDDGLAKPRAKDARDKRQLYILRVLDFVLVVAGNEGI
jgi:hypothetical protein